MHRTALALAALSLCLCATLAQDAAPVLPTPARGFDEGRTELMREAGESPFDAARLPARLLEDADLPELAVFCALHLTPTEKLALDTKLKLGGTWRNGDASALAVAFAARKIAVADVLRALGDVAAANRKLSDVVAWLYLRGFNFHALQRAMNGERLDSIRLRRLIRERAAAGKSADTLFSSAFWEFNLQDAREELGGHYDGVQFVEGLIALGWTEADFAKALAKYFPRGLEPRHKTLVAWGDAHQIWPSLSQAMSESEMVRAALAHVASTRKKDDPALLALCLLRARTCDRWLRTGGPGVVGVWTGPLPGSSGEPKPPALAEAMATADGDAFAANLSDPLRAHFAAGSDQLTIVAYADGSARMMLDRKGRAALKYGPDTPPGGETTRQFYEGRFSLDGRIGFASLVFATGLTAAPAEIDLVNVRLAANGALMTADLDNGVTLTPMLLRRASRLVDAP